MSSVNRLHKLQKVIKKMTKLTGKRSFFDFTSSSGYQLITV